MMTEIETKIPISFLKMCDAKHEYIPGTDEAYKYHHYPDCRCNGSGQIPTSLGYAVMVFLKWVFAHHAWYITGLHANPTTMTTVIDWHTSETIRLHKESEKIREARRSFES